MNYDRIDVLEPGWGTIWQGGDIDASIDQPPFADPMLVIDMDPVTNDQYINHEVVEAVLAVWIQDSPTACLKDGVLLGLGQMAVAWLKGGGNCYVHCQEGISRASYMDVTIHCLALSISAVTALARIKAERPIADPNPGFWAQLQRLFPSS